ncbi:MAG: hypothetical protein JO024_06495 [Candidatus Eremiobacteraeota bacterium]|nr:hypothetical protein [Candidatus Eremiobacteraeota bacterium]MBV9736684.1 hypothetical protein [Candidatus Eremiobacteraeota bacterium]
MRATLVALLFFVPLIAATPPPHDQSDLCTIVAVETIDSVDSAKAHPGDFFRFKTINAVTDRTRIIIPPHTLGWGIVSIASPAGRGGRAGTLVMEPRYLLLPGGKKLGVVLDHKPGDLAQSGASNALPGYLGAIPVPGFGAAIGAFNYFHHGKNITVPKGTLFAIFPSDDPKTARCQNEDG